MSRSQHSGPVMPAGEREHIGIADAAIGVAAPGIAASVAAPGRQAQHPEHCPLHRKRRFGVMGCVLDAPGPVCPARSSLPRSTPPARRRPCTRSSGPRGRERYPGTSCRSSMPLSTSSTPNGMTTARRTWSQNGMIPGLPRSWWHLSLRAVNSPATSAQCPRAAEPARRPASQRTPRC